MIDCLFAFAGGVKIDEYLVCGADGETWKRAQKAWIFNRKLDRIHQKRPGTGAAAFGFMMAHLKRRRTGNESGIHGKAGRH